VVAISSFAACAAHAEPVYLPTLAGIERLNRSAVNSSALAILRYAETERLRRSAGRLAGDRHELAGNE
jgi:hypothetical protein